MTYQAGTEPRSAHRLREGGKTRPALVSAFVANIWASHKLFLRSTWAFRALPVLVINTLVRCWRIPPPALCFISPLSLSGRSFGAGKPLKSPHYNLLKDVLFVRQHSHPQQPLWRREGFRHRYSFSQSLRPCLSSGWKGIMGIFVLALNLPNWCWECKSNPIIGNVGLQPLWGKILEKPMVISCFSSSFCFVTTIPALGTTAMRPPQNFTRKNSTSPKLHKFFLRISKM